MSVHDISKANAALSGVLEVIDLQELTQHDEEQLWILLGRMHDRIESFARVHHHSLSSMTGHNMLQDSNEGE